MKKTYLGNAFSLQMLKGDCAIKIEEISLEEVKKETVISVVGHADTAAVLSTMLGVDVLMNRVSLTLEPEDTLIVAQLTGGRLPEGATELPEGFTFKFLKVTFL